MSLKWKLLLPLIFTLIVSVTYVILFRFPISEGKRVGNLVKISHKGKFSFLKTWEGTIDEGSGDMLTHHFSVRDPVLAKELYDYEGREVVLYYEQYLMGWPRETTYNVVRWTPKKEAYQQHQQIQQPSSMTNNASTSDSSKHFEKESKSAEHYDKLLEKVISLQGQALFCSLMGTIFSNQQLYQQVRTHLQTHNIYLYQQVLKCNASDTNRDSGSQNKELPLEN